MAFIKSLYFRPFKTVVRHYDADVVAITSLGGDIYKTWACDRNSTNNEEIFWLSHLLPYDLPGARIFTFGYPSRRSSNRLVAGVDDFARSLLQALRQLSDKVACTNLLLGSALTFKGNLHCPMIFICHSQAGIVVKLVVLSDLFVALISD
jgi:ankyrin repeat domain-containing protein 50